jgi:GT2 family glycosyltransferase
MKRIVALLTCFNRRALTVACIDALYRQRLPEGWTLGVVLVDDGSSDGTSQAVAERFPQARVVRGDGSLYWNGGMRAAMAAAVNGPAGAPEVLLWVNDDLELADDALVRLIEVGQRVKATGKREPIVVGSVYSRRERRQSYGAVEFPYAIKRVTPRFVYSADRVLPAQSMNGNLVAIFRGAWEAVGELDPIFTHTMADFDYGLRARRHGVPVVVAPGYVGFCDRNAAANTYLDAGADLRTRWRNVTGPKGRPMRAWWIYTWRHAGLLAPLLFAWPYARALMVSALPSVGGAQAIDVREE